MNWVTEGSADCSNAHVAAFDGSNALVTWEEIERPICDFQAMGCRGDFTGTFYQLVNGAGEKLGEPVKSMDSFVAGDMVTMNDGRICWPYVNMEWRLDAVTRALPSSATNKMSFACMVLSGAGSGSGGGDSTPSVPEPEESAAATTAAATTAGASTPATSPVAEEEDEEVEGEDEEDTVTVTVVPVPVPSASETSDALPVGGEESEESSISSAAAGVTDGPAPTPESSSAPALTSSVKSCRPKRRTVTEIVTVTAGAY